MDFFNLLATGFLDVFNIGSMITIIIGVFAGITVGALPGLTATMSIAVLTPFTFSLSPSLGITLLLGVYVGGIYGGSITAILLRTPGTPSAIATSFDGYPLTQQGRAGEALYYALICSVIGGLISALILITVAPQITKVALEFGPEEIFGLTIFGISIIASVSGKSMIKGLISGMLGIFLSIVGLDMITGVPRFTFGNMEVMQGFRLIPVLIGLFAVSEVLNLIWKKQAMVSVEGKNSIGKLYVPFSQVFKHWLNIVRSSLIGTFVGIVPGTGSGIAAFMAYNTAKNSSKNPEKFGNGSIEGIVSAEAANNATTGGALVPMLTLGIPGDPSTAVLISAFMIQGMQPGPLLFQTNGRTVYMLFAAFFVANIFLYLLGLLGIRLFARVTKIPVWILAPVIFILCIVGSYSVSNSSFDIIVMFVMGILGYFLFKFGFPGGPIIIGLILGPMNERALRQALSGSHGDWLTFLQSPICVVFLVLTLLSLFAPLFKKSDQVLSD